MPLETENENIKKEDISSRKTAIDSR